jgi:glycosyltransferase involved in cell wall biosynthesis
MAIVWHLLTGEYPPECGGVGDYTAALAGALSAAGDEVHVWAPRLRAPAEGRFGEVTVHALPDTFGPASRDMLERAFDAIPGVVLLQYVPNAMGLSGANLAFCRWFARMGRRLPDARVMFHEPYFYFTWSRPWARANALAIVQRLMARALARGARRVYQSTETWRRFLPGADRIAVLQTLPIPSNVPLAAAPQDVARFRERAGGDGTPLVGHFGTYGAHVAKELRAILPALAARRPDVRIALVGAGGPAFLEDLRRTQPETAGRAFVTGHLDPSSVAAALRACDVLVQPYPDGITTRRTSAMAGLANGVATVTCSGALTEPVWTETGAAALAPAGDANAFVDATDALLRDASARDALGRRGAAVYAARFSMAHTIAILRGAPAS